MTGFLKILNANGWSVPLSWIRNKNLWLLTLVSLAIWGNENVTLKCEFEFKCEFAVHHQFATAFELGHPSLRLDAIILQIGCSLQRMQPLHWDTSRDLFCFAIVVDSWVTACPAPINTTSQQMGGDVLNGIWIIKKNNDVQWYLKL